MTSGPSTLSTTEEAEATVIEADSTGPDWDIELEKRRDEAIVTIISGLDQCIDHANTNNLRIAAHILSHAKEIIINWTAHAEFQEPHQVSLPDKLDLLSMAFRCLAPFFGKSSGKPS